MKAGSKTIRVKNLLSFIEWVGKFKGGKCLYRGLPQSCYRPEASAYRRLQADKKNPADLLEINRELIEKVRRQGYDLKDGQRLSDLEVLARLQHFGAATGLIDFTFNALVALWFACWEIDPAPKKDGKVVMLRSDNLYPLINVDYEMSKNEIDYFFKPDSAGLYRYYQWTPTPQDYRINAQHSVFVFGGADIEIDEKCLIDTCHKQDILTELEELSGITGNYLFSDFEGLSWTEAADKPHMQINAKECRLRGIHAYQKAERLKKDEALRKNETLRKESLERAIRLFAQAIELDKEDPDTYFHRGQAYRLDEKYEKAIKDYNEVMRIYKKTSRLPLELAKVYNARGIIYKCMEKYEEAIKDYTQAIKLDPKNVPAYNNRARAYISMEKYEEAIKDYTQAIKLDPNRGVVYENRGEAWLLQNKQDKAEKDFIEAAELNADVSSIFQYDYKNVKDFEEKTGVSVRDSIKKMLEPQEK